MDIESTDPVGSTTVRRLKKHLAVREAVSHQSVFDSTFFASNPNRDNQSIFENPQVAVTTL
jgi:hypothetical protein